MLILIKKITSKLVVILILLFSFGAFAGQKEKKNEFLNPETGFGPGVIENFNLGKISISKLTERIQSIAGINIIYEKKLKGDATILCPGPITVGDAWKAYLAILKMNKYTIAKSGEFYKVIATRQARYTPLRVYTGELTPNNEKFVMKIFALKFVKSKEITRSFRPFLSRYGRIINLKQTNTLIIQDTGQNILRLTKLLKLIDVPDSELSIQFHKVKHIEVIEASKILKKLVEQKKTRNRRSRRRRSRRNVFQKTLITNIIAEAKLNAIIAVANKEGQNLLSSFLKKLDTQVTDNLGSQVRVYFLKNKNVEALNKTLGKLFKGKKIKRRKVRRRRRRRSQNTSNAQLALLESVTITPDKENNALLISSNLSSYEELVKVLKQLDTPQDQVYIESMILETSLTNNKEQGISLVGSYGSSSFQKFGNVQGESGESLFNLLSNSITSLGGFFLGGNLGRKVTLNIGGEERSISTINALVKAVASHSKTNVIATPQILITNNAEGIFEVGEKVPSIQKTTDQNGVSTTSVKQQTVALTLKVTPQINRVSNSIVLNIDQKIEDFSSRKLNSTLSENGISTIVRTTKTKIEVRDRDTVAMGGLLRDKEVKVESRVPLLGDIPLLGWLFTQKSVKNEKVNLIFFMTPKILRNNTREHIKLTKDIIERRKKHLEDIRFRPTVKVEDSILLK